MATCSGKAYSECPASAETNTLNPYTESPQEPRHKETLMDPGDEIEIAASPMLAPPPLDVGAGTPVDTLIAEDHHKVITCHPHPVDGADLIDCRPCSADGADFTDCHPRSTDGAHLTDCRPYSTDGDDTTDCRHCSANDTDADDDVVNTEPSQDIFLPAERTIGKVKPPNGHAIVMSEAHYFKDWSSDHCPSLPTMPPNCISTRCAPTPETPERAGGESPAWSNYDGLEDPYGEIPASWMSCPPGKSRRFMIGILDNMDSKSLREMIKDRACRMSQYAKMNNPAMSELTAPSTSQTSKSMPRATPSVSAAQKEKWRTINSKTDELLTQQLHVELNGADPDDPAKENMHYKMASVLLGVYQLRQLKPGNRETATTTNPILWTEGVK
ncbi:hypothetical protein JB92DRAFT_3108369 [Gautieria morchelliformis]|nr:hypothetical protein JB92DRAFT_3108369 [Gautieria morchelliformis]